MKRGCVASEGRRQGRRRGVSRLNQITCGDHTSRGRVGSSWRHRELRAPLRSARLRRILSNTARLGVCAATFSFGAEKWHCGRDRLGSDTVTLLAAPFLSGSRHGGCCVVAWSTSSRIQRGAVVGAVCRWLWGGTREGVGWILPRSEVAEFGGGGVGVGFFRSLRRPWRARVRECGCVEPYLGAVGLGG
jgi:hypothetical protein